MHRGVRRTYAELDEAADRVAGTLLAAGLPAEGVVAVISQRSLDWLAAILGVFKAGGVYLPIDPAFSDDRIAELLRRSGCRFSLVEGEAAVGRVEAAAVRALPLVPEGNPGGRAECVPAGAPAYLFFTFRSTGEAKGAVCEHAGFLNHLLAKVEVFELRPGAVVAQTASQCFDISLWQALAPLVVGGTTVVVDPETMLDVPELLRLLAAEEVDVLQLVPNYLSLLVTRLEQGHRMPDSLRMLGITGEAVSSRLLARWFASCPAVPVVNGYGATEASDDTTHEVIRTTADGGQVNVGAPIANVFVDVVGADGLPVGGIGEIGEVTFSGVCVGRGYVDDPKHTAEVFGADPLRPGLRRYLTGDCGRWLPGGRLKLVGRRDEQLTIDGVQVEAGAVEATLQGVPGVRSACVIVVPDGPAKRLAGFYTAASPMADIGDLLAGLVPRQQVPSTLRWLPELPLTGNGKVDRRGLADLETSMANGNTILPPRTATERVIATAWAEVLGLPLGEVGRTDDFFVRGGGSLAGVRLVVQLRGLVSLVDLMANPVLADLAAVADGVRPRGSSLLQELSVPENAVAALVCVPYEAGNALNFESMARALAPAAVAVYAVELPGHDAARPDEELAGLDRLAGRLTREIVDRIGHPVALWGHGTGAALAMETGRSLLAAGMPPRHLFVAAATRQEPRDSAAAAVEAGAWLRDSGALTDVDHWRTARGELIERAYRHDIDVAERYFATCGEPIDIPATIVVVPRAPGESGAAARCTAVLPAVRTTWFEDPDRYFVRNDPRTAAHLVAATIAAAEEGGSR